MQFRILGPLEVADPALIDLGRPKQRAVLAVLLLSPNRVVSLDRLIDLLWGEEAPARAAGPLQAYISNLRRALEPSRPARAPAEVLVTQPPGYLLRVRPGELDALEFEALAEAGRRHLVEGRPRAAHRVLSDALSLWRGPALAEFAFEPFAEREASRLEELRIVTAENRWAAELTFGGHAHVVGALEMAVAERPLRERMWELLILALYRSGRQGDALRAYDRARRILAEELGLTPSPALRRLHADVLGQSPALDWSPADFVEHDEVEPIPAVGTATATPAPAEVAGTGSPFVGREEELRTAEAVLSSARDGRGRLLLVSGEAGIGKTRLAEELGVRADAAGAPVFWARGYEGEGAPPFWPWTQMTRSLLEHAQPDSLGPSAIELAHLVPDITQRLGTEASAHPTEHGSARFRLYEAVWDLIRRMADVQPMVLVFDDLQWADPASLDLLVHVACRLDDSPVLVVATYRSEGHPTGPLGDALGALARLRTLERLDLTGLSRTATGRFLTEAAGIEATAPQVAELHTSTNGNPFFLTELASLWASQGGPLEDLVLPAGVRDVIRSRLARLPERTNALLIVGAVLGTEFDLRVAATAGRAPLGEALALVEPAVATGIVAEVSEVPGRYRFSHALVRDAIYGELGGLRRARIHARVGEALEALPDARSRVAELAFQFEQAAPAAGPERAVLHAVRAAEADHAALAYETAVGHLRRALRLVKTMPAGATRDHQELELQQRLALAVTVLGGLAAPGAKEAWERAARLARRLDDTAELLSSLLGLSACLVVRAELDAVWSIGEELLELGTAETDVRCVIAGHFALGTAAWCLGRPGVAGRELSEACSLGAQLDGARVAAAFGWCDPNLLGSAMLTLVRWLVEGGAAPTCPVEQVRTLRRCDPHPLTEAIVLVVQASLHAMRDDAPPVLHLASRLETLSREHGLREFDAAARIFRGWATVATDGHTDGHLHPALADLSEGLVALYATGFRVFGPFYRGLLGDAYRRLGRPEDALASLDVAIEEAESTGQRLHEAELRRMQGEVLVSLDRPEDGASSLRRALAVAEAQGAAPFGDRARASIVRLVGSTVD